jgi:hypothetical protein
VLPWFPAPGGSSGSTNRGSAVVLGGSSGPETTFCMIGVLRRAGVWLCQSGCGTRSVAGGLSLGAGHSRDPELANKNGTWARDRQGCADRVPSECPDFLSPEPAGQRPGPYFRAVQDRFLPKGDSRSDPRLEPAAPAASPGRVRRALQPASTTPRTTPGQPAQGTTRACGRRSTHGPAPRSPRWRPS